MDFLKMLKRICFTAVAFLIAVGTLIVGPFIVLLVFVPLTLLRDSIALVVKVLWKGQIGEMVEYLGPLAATDGPFVHDANTQFTAMEVDTPSPSVQKAREFFHTNVLTAKGPKGHLLYPELQCTVTTKLGYLFWKPCCDKFRIEKQIFGIQEMSNVTPPKWTNDDDLEALLTDIGHQEWKKGCPLWQIIIIPNVPKAYFGNSFPGLGSIILWRCHHLQNDGVAIANILFRFLSFNPPEKPITAKEPSSLQLIKGLLSVAFYLAKYGLTALLANKSTYMKSIGDSCYHHPSQQTEWRENNDKVITVISKPFPLAMLKHIKNEFSSRDLSTVMIAGIAGGITRMYVDGWKAPLKLTPAAMTLPMPNHPLSLVNYATAALTLIPTSEANPIARMEKCCGNDFAVDGVMAQVLFHLSNLLATIPFTLVKTIRHLAGPYLPPTKSVGLTNKRYTSGVMYFDKSPIVGMYIGLNVEKILSEGFGVFLCSYGDTVRFTVSSRGTGFRSRDEARRFASYCMEEWEYLYRTGKRGELDLLNVN